MKIRFVIIKNDFLNFLFKINKAAKGVFLILNNGAIYFLRLRIVTMGAPAP